MSSLSIVSFVPADNTYSSNNANYFGGAGLVTVKDGSMMTLDSSGISALSRVRCFVSQVLLVRKQEHNNLLLQLNGLQLNLTAGDIYTHNNATFGGAFGLWIQASSSSFPKSNMTFSSDGKNRFVNDIDHLLSNYSRLS
jgi:hypothetical protein